MRKLPALSICLMVFAAGLRAQPGFKTDKFAADGDSLAITFIGHGTLMLAWAGKTIHVDPVGRPYDYSLSRRLLDNSRDDEEPALAAGRISQGFSDMTELGHLVRFHGRGFALQEAVRADAVSVHLVEFFHVFEDGVQVAGHAFGVPGGQVQPGQKGDFPDVFD